MLPRQDLFVRMDDSAKLERYLQGFLIITPSASTTERSSTGRWKSSVLYLQWWNTTRWLKEALSRELNGRAREGFAHLTAS